jgi:hypothetical protein
MQRINAIEPLTISFGERMVVLARVHFWKIRFFCSVPDIRSDLSMRYFGH